MYDKTHYNIVISLQLKKKKKRSFWRPKKKEYWSGLPFPSSGNLPQPGIEPESLMFPALAGRFFFTTRTTWEAQLYIRRK